MRLTSELFDKYGRRTKYTLPSAWYGVELRRPDGTSYLIYLYLHKPGNFDDVRLLAEKLFSAFAVVGVFKSYERNKH